MSKTIKVFSKSLPLISLAEYKPDVLETTTPTEILKQTNIKRY